MAEQIYPVMTGMRISKRGGLFAGIGCLAFIVLAALVAVIASAISIGAATSSPTSDAQPPVIDAENPSSDNTVGVVESDWKYGNDWLTPPAGETPPGDFIAGYPTAESYLEYAMGAYDFTVVFTDDPTYNCGLAKATPQPDWVIGCYNPDYGDTIFLWWGPDAVDDMKALILLHEYSHYYQNYEYFDATRSAVDAGLFSDPQFVHDVWETDATCRVYIDWHYTNLEYLDSYTVSPCGNTGWGEHWFENELRERGVPITDY
jgi:hypothetical protein